MTLWPSKRGVLIDGLLILILAAAFIWLLFFSGFIFRTHAQNTQNRDAMLRIRESIALGTGVAEVRGTIDRLRTHELVLMEDSPTRWRLEMPAEGGEQAWKLLIGFEDGRVSALQVRTGDGVPPRDAPEDIETPNQTLEATADPPGS